MRKIRPLLGVLAGTLILASSATAAQRDTVSVSGQSGDGLLSEFGGLNIHASVVPGQRPTGTVSFTDGNSLANFSGKVTCMRVLGPDQEAGTAATPTTAILNAKGTETYWAGGKPTSGLWTFVFTDNGGTLDSYGNGTDVMSFGGPFVHQDCKTPTPGNLATSPLWSGRAVVVDARR